MPTVRALPDERTAPSGPEATLLESLLLARVPITHSCGGHAKCSTCRVRVLEGLGVCSPRTQAECAMALRLGLDDSIRLACQTRAEGDVTVRRLVLDPEDLELTKQATSRTGGETPSRVSAGRESPVAVLFADIQGFTQLSEALPAYDVVHILHRWFHVATRTVEAHGGRVDNYMGDGLLAVFGRGTPGEDCLDAVRAAVGLLADAERQAAYLTTAYGRSFAVRVGVHHGPVIVGTLTPWREARETVIGDVVNFASRIEAANKEVGSRLLVSDAVHALVGGRVVLGRRATLPVRGKSGVHVLFEVLGLRVTDPA